MSDVDIDTLIRRRRSRWPWILMLVAAVGVGAGIGSFMLLRGDESGAVPVPQRVEAVTGQLTTTVDLSGEAAAERSANLSFESAGLVAWVEVETGEAVQAGDTLATLDASDAQLRIENAELQLHLAQLRLEALLAAPANAEITSARQSIESAESQVATAEEALADLSEPPSASDLAGAEQAVVNARSQLSSAEQALADLSTPPSASDLASAEQAVANARSQISNAEVAQNDLREPPSATDLANAEQAVVNARSQLSSAEVAQTDLTEPPSTTDLASAEQAAASARSQLSSAEETLSELLAGPSDAEVASSRSAVTQAQAQLTDASDRADDSWHALSEAFDEFCELYGRLRVVGMETCSATLPLSDDQLAVVRDPLHRWGATYEQYADDLISANVRFVTDDAARQSAVAALSTAQEHLAEMIAPVSEQDELQARLAVEAARAGYAAAEARLEALLEKPTEADFLQARLAVEAARAGYTAARARLEELLEEPTEADFLQARLAVEAARAGYAAAEARLEELLEAPTEADFLQARLAVEAARASHAEATARLSELRAPADEGDVRRAVSSLESARAGLASAHARYEELLAGATPNEIAQQEANLRIAAISLEEARAALQDLHVVAPFDGVVETVSVQPGDRVSASVAAFWLSTTDRMLIELTVTEADLLALDVGMVGLASFDAIDDAQYPVRIAAISRAPVAAQGVVTYEVKARILAAPEIAEVANEIAILGADDVGAGFGDGTLPGLGGGGPVGLGGLPSGFALPEGVTIRDIVQALTRGEPLPEGVTLPEGFDVRLQDLQRLAEGGLGRRGGQGAVEPGSFTPRPLPAPGMSASVTILTQVREPSVLVPVSAVRQIEGGWFVAVPAPAEVGDEVGFERVQVEIGESDGANVEITSGIEAGTVLLIGADSAGIAFSAVQQQPQPPGLDFGRGLGGLGPGGRP